MKLLNFLIPLSKERKVQVRRNKNGKWFHRTVHVNGNKLQTSEDYSSKTEAVDTARALAADARFPLEIDQ